MANIIGTEQFKTHLEGWLLKADPRHADYLSTYKSGIPMMFRNYNRRLFRGMVVDDDFVERIKAGKVILDKHTSWSKDERMARKFIDDPSYSIGNKGRHKIMLAKVIPSRDQIFDIDAFVLFMGVKQLEVLGYDETNLDSASKEKEVIISKGIPLLRTDYQFI